VNVDSFRPITREGLAISNLFWFELALSALVLLVVLVPLGYSIAHFRGRPGEPDPPQIAGNRTLEFAWTGGAIALVVVLFVGTVLTMRTVSAAAPSALRVVVVGHQWWWEYRYPDLGVTTANELHLPVGESSQLEITSADVIHSFWVPQLQAKMDLIPGRVNRMWLEADRPGIYRGQCAEYCGLQHANMIFYVVAQTPAAYQAWLARESQGVAPPATADLLRGQEAFLTQPCVACHTIRGTPANGTVGPDLTHFGSRLSIGAGTVPNTPGNLAGWIVDSQGLKPGNKMPPIELPAQDLQDLVQYLESLK
jgi:cytochrome c oxidase subunit 2